jgi:fucose 4-O-acetylase-like acetyltransferase
MRESYLDTARGAGIVLVVYGHVLRGLAAANLLPAGTLGHLLSASDYTIYTFHMPLFFLLSGLHVPGSLQRSRSTFILSKLGTVVYPYLLWSVLQGLVQAAASSHGTNHPFALASLLDIAWNPFGQFWFLYALFICQWFAWALALLSPGVAERHGPRTPGTRALVLASAVLALGVGATTHWGIVSTALMSWPFVAAGMLVGGRLRAWLEHRSGPLSIAAAAAAFAAAVLFAHRFGDATSAWAVPAGIAGIALMLQFAFRVSEPRNQRTGERHRGHALARWLDTLGIASMPIYLMHIFVTAGMRVALLRLGIDNVGVHLALGTFAGVGVPVAAYVLALRLRVARLAGLPLPPAGHFGVSGRSAAAV